MKIMDSLQLIEDEWNLENGSLGKFRQGVYDNEGFERLIYILNEIEPDNDETINKRFVSLIWMLPIFISWNISRFKDGIIVKEIKSHEANIDTILQKLLGVP